jgi:molybdenum cofactor cytidylyltransferase
VDVHCLPPSAFLLNCNEVKLNAALRISDGEVVAFVGGGGKTTAMFRLADEIVEAGGRVITTTTTRIFAAQISLAPRHFSAFAASRAAVEAALDKHRHVLVTGPVSAAEGKASGVTTGLIEDLRAFRDVSAVLIEADGSRMRPLKAPAEHEPVIPDVTTLVIPVVGADVFGQPLTGERVHRPELVSALADSAVGQPVTPEIVARVLTHPRGGVKGVPAGARVIPLVNKVEAPEALAPARETASRLLAHPAITAAALGAVKRRAQPITEVHSRVGAVVLAAGRSTRMGRIKQTLPWGEGTMIGEVVRRLAASGVFEIVVVTGAAREAVETAVSATGAPARCVWNPDFETTEMALSLQAGLRALSENTQAALAALGDQPRLDPAAAQRVIQRWRETLAPVVAPVHQGRRGHPLLFDRAAWPGLFALPAHANPREFLAAAGRVETVAVDTDSILRDIDTPDDYERERGA